MYIFHLKHLDLSHNAITYIHPRAFFGQSALTGVDLSWNKLHSIDPNTIRYIRPLKWLSLAHNHITVPSTSVFLSSDHLEVLHMEHCGIKDISFLTFWELTKLRELHLPHNEIHEVINKTFQEEILRTLQVLDISNVLPTIINNLSSNPISEY